MVIESNSKKSKEEQIKEIQIICCKNFNYPTIVVNVPNYVRADKEEDNYAIFKNNN